MPSRPSRCEGLPDGPCPNNEFSSKVTLCQGDLMLCPACNVERFSSQKDPTPRVMKGLQAVVIEPVLSYAWFSMQNSSHDLITTAIMGYFSLEAVTNAKNVLWDVAEASIIGEKPRRRGTANRNEKSAHVSDILEALVKLDKADQVPCFAIDALSIGMIPKSKPEELNNISLAERLNKLEEKMQNIQECNDRIICENMVIKEQINNRKCSYADIVKKDETSQTYVKQQAAAEAYSYVDAVKHGNEPSPFISSKAPAGDSSSVKNIPSVKTTPSVKNTPSVDIRKSKDVAQGNYASSRGGWAKRGGATRGGRSTRQSVDNVLHHNTFDPLIDESCDESGDHDSVETETRAENQSLTSNSVLMKSNDDFRLPTEQLKKRARRTITGQANSNRIRSTGFRGAPEPQRELFIFRVHADTVDDEIKDYAIGVGVDVLNIECVSHPNSKFKSFRLTVPASQFRSLFDEELWPVGVRVRKYVPHKQRA